MSGLDFDRVSFAAKLQNQVHLVSAAGTKIADFDEGIAGLRGGKHLAHHQVFEQHAAPVAGGDEITEQPVEHAGVKEIEFRAFFDIRIGFVEDLESGYDQRILENFIKPGASL